MNRRRRLHFVTFLTFVRVPLVLLFLVGAVIRSLGGPPWLFGFSLTVLILAAVTDLFDGYFARKLEVTTKFGSYADPLTDKIFYLTTLPLLVFIAAGNDHVEHSVVLLFLTVLFLLRDQWVSFLRSIGSTYGVDAKANWSGKLRTVLSFPVICLAYIVEGLQLTGLAMTAIYVLEALAIAVNVISVWVYTGYYIPSLRKAMEPESDDLA